MKLNFSQNINDFLKIIVKCAFENNINVYFVGGIVRDYFLQKPICDVDLIINSNALEFVKSLPSCITVKSLHKDFYTAKVLHNNLEIDIASTRTEYYPYSGCLPKVDSIGVDIERDYLRRDFTVNSMYFKIDILNNELCYELFDFVGGLDDIKNKTLRVLHNKSYIDDPTRILRGVNFKHRFNFDFSADDKLLIKEYLKNPNLENASYDRIISVFKHVLSNENSFEIFKDIVLNKYYKIINPGDLTVDFDLISKMNVSAEFYLKVFLNNNVLKIKAENELEVIKNFSKMNSDELNYYFYKTRDENVELYRKIKDIKLLINGDDLIKLGFEKGRKIGSVLDELLLNKIKNPEKFLTKEDEINLAKLLI